MRTLMFSFATFITCLSAHATSLAPCTPIVPAEPTQMYCSDGSHKVSIRIETLMSDRSRGCEGNNYYELHTAYVQIDNGKEIRIEDGDFSYYLGLEQSSFKSAKQHLNLNDCVSPLHGGLSFGN